MPYEWYFLYQSWGKNKLIINKMKLIFLQILFQQLYNYTLNPHRFFNISFRCISFSFFTCTQIYSKLLVLNRDQCLLKVHHFQLLNWWYLPIIVLELPYLHQHLCLIFRFARHQKSHLQLPMQLQSLIRSLPRLSFLPLQYLILRHLRSIIEKSSLMQLCLYKNYALKFITFFNE